MSTTTSNTAAPRCRRAALGVDEHAVVKTLVMQDEAPRPLIVLMHGDRTVSTKNLARQAVASASSPARPRWRSATPATRSAAPRRSARASRCRCSWSARVLELPRHLHQRRPSRLPGGDRARGHLAGARWPRSPVDCALPGADSLMRCCRAVDRRRRSPTCSARCSFAVVVSRAIGLADPRTLRLRQSGGDQRAALRQQGRGDPHAARRRRQGLARGLAGAAFGPALRLGEAGVALSRSRCSSGHLFPVFLRLQGRQGRGDGRRRAARAQPVAGPGDAGHVGDDRRLLPLRRRSRDRRRRCSRRCSIRHSLCGSTSARRGRR